MSLRQIGGAPVSTFLQKLSKNKRKQTCGDTDAARSCDMTLSWWHRDREPPTEGGAAVRIPLKQKSEAKKRKPAWWQDNDQVWRLLYEDADALSPNKE